MRDVALELRAHGHPEAAHEILDRALAWRESQPPEDTGSASHRYDLATTLYTMERCDEAEPLIRDLAAEFPDDVRYLGYVGALAARRGDRETALAISEELAAIDRPYLFGYHTRWRARIAAVLGEHERAVALLREAFSQGSAYELGLHREIDFEPLRDDRSFEEFLRPKG
jgi:predicted Zn-dependent protease